VCNLDKRTMQSLDFTMNRFFMKLLKTSNMEIVNLYLSKRNGAQRLLSEFPNYGWKPENIDSDSLLKRIRKTGTIVRQPLSNRPCSACSSGGPCAQSGGQAKKAPISSRNFAWNCHSPFKCAQDNSQFTVISSSNASNDVVISCCLKPIASPVSLAQ